MDAEDHVQELIIGGARSGKSRYAESRAAATGDAVVVYIATTTEARDEANQPRGRCRQKRPANWRTVHGGPELAATLASHAARGRCLLVDGLAHWLGRLIDSPARLADEREALLATLPRLPGHVILVGTEVGLGTLPTDNAARRIIDETGHLHQALAEQCARVVLMVAGLPQVIKDKDRGY